jgi:hypothetical protein
MNYMQIYADFRISTIFWDLNERKEIENNQISQRATSGLQAGQQRGITAY